VLHDSNSLTGLICLEGSDKLYVDVTSCLDLITTGLIRPSNALSEKSLIHIS